MKKRIALLIVILFVLGSLSASFAQTPYTVQAGDVLWKIAAQYDLSWESVAEYNALSNPHLIFPGQQLMLPGGAPMPPPPTAPQPPAATETVPADLPSADMVWLNGVLYTADAADTFAEAVAVKDGLIIFVGSTEDAAAYISDATEVVDLEGKMMLPGMTDSHLHAPGTILSQLYQIDLNGILTESATMAAIEAYVADHPDMEMYYGDGFSIGAFSGEEVAKGPRKERLDAITDKPMIISSYDGHVRWLNSAAFEYYGITSDTQSPAGGVIEKTEDGELWGTLKELAIELTDAQEFSEEQFHDAFVAFQEYMHSLGYVGITDMGSGILAGAADDPFADMDQKGELKLYVMKNTVMDPNSALAPQLQQALANRAAHRSERYTYDSVKFFADGVIEGVTGYLLEPYTAEAGAGDDFVSGPLWTPEQMQEAFTLANAAGFQIHVHSIGDASTRQVLDAFEYALDENGPGDYRNVITHLQLVDEEDIPRFAPLGVIANLQPYWAFKEPYWWEVVDEPLLGPERAEREYPMQSFINAGALLVSSSDHSVTPYPIPFWAIEVGVTRNLNNPAFYEVDDIEDMDDPAWLLAAEERVSLTDMIKSFTINAAFQNFREDTTGSIEVGKSADFIIISQNLFDISPLDIDRTEVLATIFKGQVVWTAE
ncbi:MAG: amidohydrolase family protein [Bacillota bacterium]|nr:amidohydrolase family protein [Bacillota bacterium]MDW7676540.1 amidohydrolase family protein [Bacillota bacterium]